MRSAANIAALACDRHARARPQAVAVIEHHGGRATAVTYTEIHGSSARIAGGLAAAGVGAGDRVAISLPQSAHALAWHLAVLRIGAISVPIAPVFAGEGLRHRLSDSGAVILATDAAGFQRLAAIERPASLRTVVGDAPGTDLTAAELCAVGPRLDGVAPVAPEDPAFVFYTSGSTGPAKGVVIGHRVLPAAMRGFARVFDRAPRPRDVFWTPSDWSWLGALVEVVLAAAACGRPVVACPDRFTLGGAYAILAEHRVTCAFLVPHVLRRIRADPPPAGVPLALRAVMTGGERLSADLRADIERCLRASLNDDFGLTEGTHLAVGCQALYATPPGAIGRAVPGRRIAVLAADGGEQPPGAAGEIAVAADDPIVMLGYWNQPELTAHKLRGGWLHTGDRGRIDENGFLWFEGREGDVLRVGGMLVGAEEIEAVLGTHPAVLECGIATGPSAGDAAAGIVAYVQLRAPASPSPGLADALRAHVRTGLAAHAYPRVVRFVAALPHTSTGKVRREALSRLDAAGELALLDGSAGDG